MVEGRFRIVLIIISEIYPGPHAAILYTCDGMSQRCCDALNLHEMFCDRKFNIIMFNIIIPIWNISAIYLSSDFQTVCRISMDKYVTRNSQNISDCHWDDYIAGENDNIPS